MGGLAAVSSTGHFALRFQVQKDTPQLVNISDDPSLSGALLYFLEPERSASILGSDESCRPRLMGLGIKPFMCSITNTGNEHLVVSPLTERGEPVGGGQDQDLGTWLLG